MVIFRLKNTLIPSDDSSWKQLVTDSLGADVHPKRALGFCLAREALRECLKTLNQPLSIPELVLKGYGELQGFPGLKLSLSHSADWGAAAITTDSRIVSLGIDMEPLERVVKPMILGRIAHPHDLDLSPLSIWALKEAIFKSLMNTLKFENPLEFSSIQIGDGVWTQSESQISGEWKLEQIEGQLVALAWIKI